MNRVDQTYDRPREKVKSKGVAALNDIELLQLMIGSGTGKTTVGKIARKTALLLKRHGSGVTYQQLSGVNGLGPARVSQLLAMFELASRYPVDNRRTSLRTGDDRHRQFIKEKLIANEFGYITLDGAARLLRHRTIKRTISIDTTIRRLCADAVSDKATQLYVGRYTDDRLLIPTLADLDVARNLAHVAQLLGFTTNYYLYNHQDWHSVSKDVSHVER
jgi:DNA repair protein RadC